MYLKLNKKSLKKLLTTIYYDDIVILVLEMRATGQQKSFEKMLTKKNSFDTMKKLKQAKNFEN